MGSLPRILPITVIDSQTPVPAEAGHHHDADEGPRSLGQPAADRTTLLAPLEARVRLDLDLRSRAVAAHRLSLERELFLFGRPLFQLLAPLGIGFDPASGRLHLVPTRIPPVTG